MKTAAERRAALMRRPAAAPSASALPSVSNGIPIEDHEKLRRQFVEERNKSQQALAAATKEATDLRDKLAKLEGDRKSDRIRAALIKAASLAHDPDEVADLNLAKYKLAEDGRVVQTDAPDIDADIGIKSFLEAKPHHAKSKVQPGTGAPPLPGTVRLDPPKPAAGVNDRTAALHSAIAAELLTPSNRSLPTAQH